MTAGAVQRPRVSRPRSRSSVRLGASTAGRFGAAMPGCVSISLRARASSGFGIAGKCNGVGGAARLSGRSAGFMSAGDILWLFVLLILLSIVVEAVAVAFCALVALGVRRLWRWWWL